ncbi:transaldolase [Nakamurella antarctica]|uniref:Transaldolase n=1 Tax=Nakamurella antarctica TaxID=1902245 RepID=A0A3G8ZVM7_9ACTN|nr:transaldolase [Nakamurella antarctica]AZI58066.1 transaldolase [Nakamurella antarctica]
MSNDRLADLTAAGVSLWLDDLSRNRIKSGDLENLIATKHISGVTTNPTIFAGALSKGEAYAEQVAVLAKSGATVDEAVRALTTDDVRDAADIFAGVFAATDGVDGRVSIEVEPGLANDTEATTKQARELSDTVDRPNLLVKIPATVQGLSSITATLAEGISVNVTLIFSLDRYAAVIEAFIEGIKQAQAAGKDVSKIHSVASFFVSRVDSEIDKRLDAIGTEDAKSLKGKAAIANARLAYELFEKRFAAADWAPFAAEGAHAQRPLWASTGVKDPAYDDTQYVVELVAPGTVNTAPEKTIDAVADHGVVRGDTIDGSYDAARQVFADLGAVGIDLDDVYEILETEGVSKFIVSWGELLETVKTALAAAKA